MSRRRILVIEDNTEMRENISEMLELANYDVRTAENGKLGVAATKEFKPELILCDVMMPELDGYGVLHMLGNDPTTMGIPFVFLTAKTELADLRKGMSMGADDYLTKPFEEMDLLNAIEVRLKKSDALKAEHERSIDGIEKFLDQVSGDWKQVLESSKNRRVRKYDTKEYAYREGDSAYFLLFLNRGKVRTFKMHEDGKEYTTGLYNAGEFFGYTALMQDGVYNDSALVIDGSEIYQIPKEDFHSLLYSDREVAAEFIRLLAGNIMEKEEQLLSLAYSSVRKRVADALVLLQRKYNTENKESFTISLNRDDLASIVGTATETVIRALSEFKDEGLIESKGREIHVLNLEGLARLRY